MSVTVEFQCGLSAWVNDSVWRSEEPALAKELNDKTEAWLGFIDAHDMDRKLAEVAAEELGGRVKGATPGQGDPEDLDGEA